VCVSGSTTLCQGLHFVHGPLCLSHGTHHFSICTETNELFVSVPDGQGDAASVDHVQQTMAQLHRALACGKDALPNVAQLKHFVAGDFLKPSGAQSAPFSTHTTRGAFVGGGVVDMTLFASDPDDHKTTVAEQRGRYIDNDWETRIWPDTQQFVLYEFIPLVEAFNREVGNDVRISGMSGVHVEYEIVNKGERPRV
jgi:hypothetical protein